MHSYLGLVNVIFLNLVLSLIPQPLASINAIVCLGTAVTLGVIVAADLYEYATKRT